MEQVKKMALVDPQLLGSVLPSSQPPTNSAGYIMHRQDEDMKVDTVFSKWAWFVPLKNKSESIRVNAFKVSGEEACVFADR